MLKFDFLKSYIFEPNDDKAGRSKHSFFKLKKQDIENAEKRLDFRFPVELRDFYSNIGYGFMCNCSSDMFDRLMDPESVADFRLCQGMYDSNEPNEYYTENFLVFFEVSEVSFIAMDLKNPDKAGQCPIYYFDLKIADSLEEFLIKMNEKDDYYLDLNKEGL